MIVTCPACHTRYQVDEAHLGGAAGRRVRCASCGNTWHCSAEVAAIQEAIAEVTAEAVARSTAEPRNASMVPPPAVNRESEPDALEGAPRLEERLQRADERSPTGPAAEPRPSVAVEMPTVRRRHSIVSGSTGVILLLVVVVLGGYVARDEILVMWPSAAPLYYKLRLAVPPGAGLKVTVTPTRTADALVIDGAIVNRAAVPRPVPKLRVTLRDGNRAELGSQVIDPPVATLAPGATAHFATTFEHPSITASRADVSFVTN